MSSVKDIQSPSGLDLNPAPPSPVRLSKRAGIVGLVVVFAVVALIGYGIYSRGQKQFQVGFHADESRGITAATEAGKLVSAQVPNRALTEATELTTLQPVAPEPATSALTSSQLVRYYQPPPAPSANADFSHPPELTIAERRLIAAYEREQEALSSPTIGRQGFDRTRANASGRADLPSASGEMAQMTTLLRTMQGPNPGNALATGLPNLALGGRGPSEEDYSSQNMQDSKDAFLAAARKPDKAAYLQSTRIAPLGRYELKGGWDIPAILEQALNSDLPGEIKALVRENVYDTATGRYLLIPQGARLVGSYDSRVSYGQQGLQVAWSRVIFPDASSINLEGMIGQDAQGYAGLRHDVDNHYKRMLGFGLLTSLFSASFQLSQTRRGGVLGYPSAGEITGSAVGREMSQLGADVTRRNLNIQPTIKVPIGYRFNVRVNRDILFEAPYRPLDR